MKQFTNKEQTQYLIELGFPRPESISEVNYYDEAYTTETEFEYDYSIGELIEFLPKKVNIKGGLEIVFENGEWLVMYGHDPFDNYYKRIELIDALFDYCVKLKNEGVI